MTRRVRRTPEEQAALERRLLSAWDAGEESALNIAKAFRCDRDVVIRVAERAFAEGRTSRDPHPPSTRATRTGRM